MFDGMGLSRGNIWLCIFIQEKIWYIAFIFYILYTCISSTSVNLVGLIELFMKPQKIRLEDVDNLKMSMKLELCMVIFVL